MPRKADARLEGRILDAAYRLWSEGGEHALTMRAVARAAGTTTPTLYERFRDKDDLMALLRRRARLNLFSAIKPSRSPVDACRNALDFFAAHPIGQLQNLLTNRTLCFGFIALGRRNDSSQDRVRKLAAAYESVAR